MSEATFGLAVMIFIVLSLCWMGFLLLFPSQIDRMVAWWRRKRA